MLMNKFFVQRNMKKLIWFLLIAVLVAAGTAWLVYWYSVNTAVSETGRDIVFQIEPGQGVKEIGANLEKVGLIESSFFFETYVWRQEAESGLQAGSYSLNPSQSIVEIIEVMLSGNTIDREITIRILEGWSIADIDEYLSNKNLTEPQEFSSLAGISVKEWPFAFSKPGFVNSISENLDLEGFLFPDTYRIYNDSSAEDIIQKMLVNFEHKAGPEIAADNQRDMHEVVAMASLVEKEVRSFEDMRKVAGIFWQRIANGQPLESCATLAYILGVDKARYTTEDTNIESPYNTYRNQGLPPGPICNPGLNAIKAAINPEITDYNYFLSRQDTGETVFSRTYDEHLRNKARFLD